ncbi:PREDICTED: uncharacterized protein LOC105569825 isoform X2 [Vollenhovia emeryi]|uniref:uncharacterized protein LOC105569825 isoform X2 n=1 Tax=Vollenhovia emeryi TaxID=411798 RepID=UPI0005F55311|nr:PREDICTED: uncharacterized protein LOC105569825 isoform X2 [Vollenhovia emeryi]
MEYKCGNCGWLLKYDQLAQHSCFANTDLHTLLAESGDTTFTTENETIEESINDKDRLDEDLIAAVKNKPALYDFRLPLKQRGRKQKDDLWNEVSVDLKGKIMLSYIK